MAGEPIPSSTSAEFTDDRLPATRLLRAAAEAVLFVTIFGGVWAFAGDLPEWEFALGLGVALLTTIWVARCVLYRRLSLRPDFVTGGLAGIIFLSAVQLIPLPLSIVSVLSPGTAHAHRTYRPDKDEVIEGETGPPAERPTWVPLSADPSLTRKFLNQVLAVLFVYTVCRNWLSSRRAFRRFAWVATVTGFLLAMLAFAQFFSSDSPSIMYWSVDTGGSVFGPFVCKNHYPFFLTPCIGLGVGLLTTPDRSTVQQSTGSSSEPGLKGVWYDFTAWLGQASQSPRTIGLLGMLGVMILSIPFSLSRGGLLSLLLASAVTLGIWRACADRKQNTDDRSGVGAVLALAGFAVGLALFLGWDQVEKRVSTLGTSAALDSRLPLWQDSLRLVPDYPLFGTGSGTLIRVEPVVRTSGDSFIRQDNAHNEYLDALVEGGLVRLLLTGLLVYGAISTAVRGYRRLLGRSTGQLLLGSVFALTAISLHSFGEFGIHVPAVALLVAAVAGYAAAAADDPDYAPTKRTKHGLSGAAHSEKDLLRSGEHLSRVRAAVVLTGPPALAGLALVFCLAALMAWEFKAWDRVERLRTAAILATKDDTADRFQRRLDYQSARVRVIPDDPNAHMDLAHAYFDSAIALDPLLQSDSYKEHILKGLKAFRTARNLCPVLPNPHFHFGLYRMQERKPGVKWFVSADNAEKYFDRVKALLPIDPEAWYVAGVEAYERNDVEAAYRNWKQSLTLSPRQLKPILAQVDGELGDTEIRKNILPRDAIILMMAADELHPNIETDRAARKEFLDMAAVILKEKSNQTSAELEVLARVYEQKGEQKGALDAWRRAVESDPENAGIHERFAKWLEGEELYEDAIRQLEWLREHSAGGLTIRDRIDMANRGKFLRDAILSR